MVVLLVSSYKRGYKYVCIMFNVNFKIVINTVAFTRNNPAHVSYTKVNSFVYVAFNISVLHVSKFAIYK